MDLSLVALAAGVGSRYGGLKQLEPVGPCGEVLLEYAVYDALRAGFSQIVVVVRPETEPRFRVVFEHGLARRTSLSFAHQTLDDLPKGCLMPEGRVKPWGTGQALLAARSQIQGPFAVVNADDFYGAESYASLARFLARVENVDSLACAMVGFEVGQTLSDSGPVSRGLCRLDEHGHLEEIIEVPEMWKRGGGGVYRNTGGHEVTVSGAEVVSMNMWGFTRELFPELERSFREFLAQEQAVAGSEFLLPDVVRSLLRENRIEVDVLRRAGQWCGITFPQDRDRVAGIIAAKIAAGEYPDRLWG